MKNRKTKVISTIASALAISTIALSTSALAVGATNFDAIGTAAASSKTNTQKSTSNTQTATVKAPKATADYTIPDMHSRVSTISVSSIKVEWDAIEGHEYEINCAPADLGEPAELNDALKYSGNIRYRKVGTNKCYVTGLRENSYYVVTVVDLTQSAVEAQYAHTEDVSVIQEYQYVSGWTNCFTYENASGLKYNPSAAAIAGAIEDPVTGTGIMRNEYGDYCVAMGLFYGRCGDRFLIELDNGTQFTVKICDSKGYASDGQGIYHNFAYGKGKCIVEFIVNSAPQCVRRSGNYGSYSWDGLIFDNIAKISQISYGDTITY